MIKTKNKKIILASTSPRRKELFGKLGLPFVVATSDYVEDMNLKVSPRKLALILSYGKASAVAKKYRSGIVIGADTFVVLDNHLLGKPKDKADARKMLRKISGRRVDILTGMAIIDVETGNEVNIVDISKAFIKKLSLDEISKYIASGEPMGKAGAFAIQGLGAVIIERIEGDFMGAMGLPLFTLARELKKFGVNVL